MSQFYRRRALRILPAYYIALLFAFLIALSSKLQPLVVARPVQITDLLAYALLTQTVFNSTVASINGSFWTIALEFQLYLVFPILLWVYKKKGLFGIITLGIATTLLWELFYMWYSSQPASSVVMGNRDLHFPARWIEFIFGMVAALFVSHPSPRQTKLSLLILVLVFPVSISALFKLSVASLAILWGITFGALIVSCAELPESLLANISH